MANPFPNLVPQYYATNAGSLDPVALTYTPGVSATSTRQTARYYRGSGVTIQFSPPSPTVVDEGDYEVRIGVVGDDEYDSYTVADGNLTVDEPSGEIVANPTAAESSAWSLTEPMAVELWRTDSDDSTAPVARARLTIVETLH